MFSIVQDISPIGQQGDCALWNSQLNLAGKPSQLISGTLLGILGLGRQFVRARAVWSRVNQPWRLAPYRYLEMQDVLCKLALRRSCWCAVAWNVSKARGASRLPSRPTRAAVARSLTVRLTGPYLKRCDFENENRFDRWKVVESSAACSARRGGRSSLLPAV